MAGSVYIFMHAFIALVFLCNNAAEGFRYHNSLRAGQQAVAGLPHQREIAAIRAIPLNQMGSMPVTSLVSARVQRIRDLSAQRDVLKDITAAEFALKLEVTDSKTKIDYDSLIAKLEYHVGRLKIKGNDTDIQLLINRIEATRQDLLNAKTVKEAQIIDSNAPKIEVDERGTVTAIEKKDRDDGGFRLVLREDGTVDWDGAVASSREVAKFGKELWVRLNGKEVETPPALTEVFGQAQPTIPVTEDIEKLQTIVNNAQKVLTDNVLIRDSLKTKLREIRKQGQPISADDIRELRMVDLQTKVLEKRLRLSSVDLDMERICVYLQQEIESSVDAPDLRTLVAEVGLIDKQIQSLVAGFKISDPDQNSVPQSPESGTISDEGSDNADVGAEDDIMSNAGLISLIDDDELNLICGEVADLKARLGLSPQTGKPMDWGTLGVFADESLAKIQEGLAFYSVGTKILVTDMQYGWQLIMKAAQGTTLKAREVNSIRRTGKDLLTLIPFTIILIIPLSPVGHVLVFSFIQRFFPDFFPSCYTEKRQNLGRLYSEIGKKPEDDILGAEDPSSWLSIDFSSIRAMAMDFSSNVGKQISGESSSER